MKILPYLAIIAIIIFSLTPQQEIFAQTQSLCPTDGSCYAYEATCNSSCSVACTYPAYCTPGGGGGTPGGGGGGTPGGGGGGTPGGGGTITLPNPLGSASDIPTIIRNIINFLGQLATPIVAGMVIYGAYQILFAAGDPEKFATGRRTILYAVIGYAIIWIGWGVSSIIQSILSG